MTFDDLISSVIRISKMFFTVIKLILQCTPLCMKELIEQVTGAQILLIIGMLFKTK